MITFVSSEDLLDNNRIDRPNGYYWVKFPYENQTTRWEPAGWNNRVKMWSLMASADLWYEFQLLEVGEEIKPPPINAN